IGALVGTIVGVYVPKQDETHYRTRKGTLGINVFSACNFDREFIYHLVGWEGSAHDGLVLRDAISRPNDLHVPKQTYSSPHIPYDYKMYQLMRCSHAGNYYL
ncbi:hypothetical protein LINPERHAP1_LOCUS20748, partial [Linum perenne]